MYELSLIHIFILPAAWALGKFVGLDALWYSFPIAEIVSFLISFVLLWREYQHELCLLYTSKLCMRDSL